MKTTGTVPATAFRPQEPPANQAGPSWLGSATGRTERWLGRCLEVAVAILVAAEIVLLFSGAVSRYVFRQPLTWSDEIASMLFLWLAMLGAAVAFRRGEHMRMSALVNRLPAARRNFLTKSAAALTIAFLAIMVWPACEYAADEVDVQSATLHIPNVWRAAAMPVGLVLMGVFALLALRRRESWLPVGLTIAAIVLVGALLWAARPWLLSIGNYRLIVFFIVLVSAGVFSGWPIAFVFAMSTTAFLAVATQVPLTLVVSRMDEGMSHLILLSVPLFVFLGLLIEATGMARTIVNFLGALIGHVRGGLSYVLVGGMFLVSGISGSKAADMAALAPGLFPEMRKRGAKDADLGVAKTEFRLPKGQQHV